MVVFHCDKCAKEVTYRNMDTFQTYLGEKYVLAMETPKSFKSTVDNLCGGCLKTFVKDYNAAKETSSRLSKEPYSELLKRYSNE